MKKSGKQNGYWLTLGLVLIGGLIVLARFLSGKKTANQKKRQPYKAGTPMTVALTESQIRQVIQPTKYSKYLPWIIGIAKHETGNFTSRLFVDNHNLFGMSVPKKRPFLGFTSDIKHEGMDMAKYLGPSDSVADFVEYMNYFKYPTDILGLPTFISFMKSKGYFSDKESTYLKGVERYVPEDERWLQIGFASAGTKNNLNATIMQRTSTPLPPDQAVKVANEVMEGDKLPPKTLIDKKTVRKGGCNDC